MPEELIGTWRMKVRRKKRKDRLLQAGFLKFEAEIYSKLPADIPYAKKLYKDRAKLYKKALKGQWTKEKYKLAILYEYDKRGIVKKGKYFGKAEAYALLRSFESDWLKTADPNDPYLRNKRTHHGHKEVMDRDKVLKQKAEYRQRNADKIKEYRRTHREQIRESERKRRDFIKRQGSMNG
jgi:hypothetical protein